MSRGEKEKRREEERKIGKGGEEERSGEGKKGRGKRRAD